MNINFFSFTLRSNSTYLFWLFSLPLTFLFMLPSFCNLLLSSLARLCTQNIFPSPPFHSNSEARNFDRTSVSPKLLDCKMVTTEPVWGVECHETGSPTRPTAEKEKDQQSTSPKEEFLHTELNAVHNDNSKKGAEAEAESAHGRVEDCRKGDGWETASEGENAEEKESFEDAMTDEQQKQRSLAQANDAKTEGNRLFVAGEYEEALAQYASALEITPDHSMANELRSMCYGNRATCYYKLSKYEETIKESTKALEINPAYTKALVRRAEAHEKRENFEEAIADMKKVLESDVSNEQASRTIIRLEPLAAEKREKLKEEMIGKLKDLGNSVLGRFGMSIDNFKAVKDPNTGSYSISFQR